MSDDIRILIDGLHRTDGPRVLATLVRVFGDIDLAEDALQDAFSAALRQWPTEGVPDNPRAWLTTTGRFKATDVVRRRAKSTALPEDLASEDVFNEEEIKDDTLRLIFLCSHPSLPEEGRVALTLREVCGLTTEEIAKAFLAPPATLAQRIVRAKAKIREDRIPFELPHADELPDRLGTVLRVAYLVFNEGYFASSGYSLVRASLTEEAIRLARLLAELHPDPEVFGLLALMLLQESRRSTRVDSQGDLILLADQDRSKWNQVLIHEGSALAARAGRGAYGLQAAIAAVHAQSPSADETDWREIVRLYDLLLGVTRSEVVELNRAVAVAMRDGPEAGLGIIEKLVDGGKLGSYSLAHSARADLLRRSNRLEEAHEAYETALELTTQEPERRFLAKRIQEMKNNLSIS